MPNSGKTDEELLQEISKEIEQYIDDMMDLEYVAPKKKKISSEDGMTCKQCRNFYKYAEPNQDDNTLICYSCRHYG